MQKNLTLNSFLAADYHTQMATKFQFERSLPIDEEDRDTLAAIDEGLRDAEAGRTVPAEAVRRFLTQWISDSSTH